MVIVTVECPRRFDTIAMSTPAASISDACPCRRSCSRTRRSCWRSPAARRPRTDGVEQAAEELGDVIRAQGVAVVMGEHEPVVPVRRLPLAALLLLLLLLPQLP